MVQPYFYEVLFALTAIISALANSAMCMEYKTTEYFESTTDTAANVELERRTNTTIFNLILFLFLFLINKNNIRLIEIAYMMIKTVSIR